jgi:hypothetical protein
MQALVRASGVPVVFEIDSSHPDIEQDLDLAGRTVRQSLDLFTELNPSYSWREYDGVVVVRPLAAWSDPRHYFNRSVARLSWTDVTAGKVLENVVELMWGIPATRTPAMGSRETRTFNVDVQSGSVLTVLIAAARGRGDMVWFIGTIGPRMLVLDQDSLGYRLFTAQGEFDTDPIGGMSGMSHLVKPPNERR